MSKNIVVIPGVKWQIPLINKIHEMGYRVLSINPVPDSPAFAVADDYIVADIVKVDTYLEQLRQKHVDAVLSDECDAAMKPMALLSMEFGVPSQTLEMAELYTNKLRMRDFLQKHNLPCPKYKLCTTLEEAIIFYGDLDGLMIIKPMDSSSSHGVFTIHNERELKDHFEETKAFSRVQNAVICEQYIDGTEFTVDGIKTEHGHVCLAISEKKHYAYNENIAYELFFSHENPKYDYNRIREINDQYVNLSGLPFGLTHAEYKYENGEFYLIEIGARGGGNLISADIVPCMSGYDNYKALIQMSLGQQTIQPSIQQQLWNRCAVLEFFDAPGNGGMVSRIEGEDFLKNNPNILSYQFNFKVGDIILPAVCDSARIGFYIAYADSREELLALMEQIKEKVQFIY